MHRRSKTGPLQKQVIHVNNGTKSELRETKLDESSEIGEPANLQRTPEGQDSHLTGSPPINQEPSPSAEEGRYEVFRTETSGAGPYLRPEDAISPQYRPPDLDSVDNIINDGHQRKHKCRTDPKNVDIRASLGNATERIHLQNVQNMGNVSEVKVHKSALLKPYDDGVEGKRSVSMTGSADGVDLNLSVDHSLHQNNSTGVQNTRRDRQGMVQISNKDYSTMEEGDESGAPPQSRLTVGAGSSSMQVKPTTTSSQSLARERKLFLTLTYIIVAFLICWMPFHVSFDIIAVDPDLVPSSFYAVTYWLAYINSAANPFLYHSSSPEFRKAFARLCGR